MGCHVPACLLPALHKVQGGFRVPHRPQVLGVGTAAGLLGFPRARRWGNGHPTPRAFPVSTLLRPCHTLTKACFLLSLLWAPPHAREGRNLPGPPLPWATALLGAFKSPPLHWFQVHTCSHTSGVTHHFFLSQGSVSSFILSLYTSCSFCLESPPLCSSGPFLLRIWGFV